MKKETEMIYMDSKSGELIFNKAGKITVTAENETYGSVSQIIEGKTSWQKLYELYEIYGEDSTIWNKYLNNKQTTIPDFISTIKNIDINSVQTGIKNIQKTINLLQEIGLDSNNKTNNYYCPHTFNTEQLLV